MPWPCATAAPRCGCGGARSRSAALQRAAFATPPQRAAGYVQQAQPPAAFGRARDMPGPARGWRGPPNLPWQGLRQAGRQIYIRVSFVGSSACSGARAQDARAGQARTAPVDVLKVLHPGPQLGLQRGCRHPKRRWGCPSSTIGGRTQGQATSRMNANPRNPSTVW